MITLITVESNSKEALLINAGLQAARSGPEQQAHEGWVLQGWNLLSQKCQSTQTPYGFQPSCEVARAWA